MIPAFNENGWLPEGVYDCSLDDAAARFGTFQVSDRRPRLWAKFAEFVADAKTCGLIESLLLDGSYVTAIPEPNDIDIVIVVPASCNLAAELRPAQYNMISQRRVRTRFGFDIVVVRQGSDNLALAVQFFQQVKQRPSERKGLLRITL